jgi:hypothetical protein
MAMSDAPTKSEKTSDNSNFYITPRIVWAYARDPYDLAFWQMVRDIAGEHGECILSTPQQSAYAMMSTGKLTEIRQFWIDNGLLEGELRRDPLYANYVWHLRIPKDIWIRNAEWAFDHPTITSRIKYKQEQRGQRKGTGPLSPHESPPPHETDPSLRETDPSPHETKKDLIKDSFKDNREFLLQLLGDARRNAENHFPETATITLIREDGKLQAIQITGLGRDNAAWLDDRITRTLERALVGEIGKVAVSFAE